MGRRERAEVGGWEGAEVGGWEGAGVGRMEGDRGGLEEEGKSTGEAVLCNPLGEQNST